MNMSKNLYCSGLSMCSAASAAAGVSNAHKALLLIADTIHVVSVIIVRVILAVVGVGVVIKVQKPLVR